MSILTGIRLEFGVLKMIPRLILSLILILFLNGYSKDGIKEPPESQLSAVEYTILATIINSPYFYTVDSVLVLEDSAFDGIFGYDIDSILTARLEYVNQHLPALKLETIRDFKTKNLTKTYINDPLSIHPACVLSDKTDITFPQIEVSRVGISSDGKQALAYVERIGASLGSTRSYHLLVLENGKSLEQY